MRTFNLLHLIIATIIIAFNCICNIFYSWTLSFR